ncbi:MAG: hypothetical protein N3E37_02190 [Candidatus Micrarchaeota archaeon]|nr:hypothetical protein [Candidatus Micrarchaeota archaeon]
MTRKLFISLFFLCLGVMASTYFSLSCYIPTGDFEKLCGRSYDECVANARLYEGRYPGCNLLAECTKCNYTISICPGLNLSCDRGYAGCMELVRNYSIRYPNCNVTNYTGFCNRCNVTGIVCPLVHPACGSNLNECVRNARALEQSFVGCDYQQLCKNCRYNSTLDCPVVYPVCWGFDSIMSCIAVMRQIESKYPGCNYTHICSLCKYICQEPPNLNVTCPDALPLPPCGNSLDECIKTATEYDNILKARGCPSNLAAQCSRCQYQNKTLSPCVVSGCDKDICADRSYTSNCLNRPWSRCYELIKCERIPELDYECGWRFNESFRECYVRTTDRMLNPDGTPWCPHPSELVKSYQVLNCTQGYNGCFKAAYRLNKVYLGCNYEKYCEICRMRLEPV